MIIGYARDTTTEQNLGLWHQDLTRGTDASVDQPPTLAYVNDQPPRAAGPLHRIVGRSMTRQSHSPFHYRL